MTSINNLKTCDALYEFLTSLSYTSDIICISETRIKMEPLINISLPNYNFIHATTNAGGVAIYVLSNHKYVIDRELEMNITGCKDLWLNLFAHNKSSDKITIGAIYRHPDSSNNNVRKFSDTISNSIKKIHDQKCGLYIRDMNIDISTNKRTSSCKDYIDDLVTFGSVPIIIIPTHVTESLSTIIDHIITNDVSHIIMPGIIRCDHSLSDHYVTFCVVKGFSFQSQMKTYYTIKR